MKKKFLLLFALTISLNHLFAYDSIKVKEITVFRFSPDEIEISLHSGNAITAKEWSESKSLDIVINAGMFGENRKHLGYMSNNSSHINKYQSFFFANPKNKDLPKVKMADRDEEDCKSLIKYYDLAIQNLRLIKSEGENRWKENYKEWSEIALGIDQKGNLIIAFSRHPYSMYTFNEILLNSDLGIIALQHLEGGPEASLYFKDVFEGIGSYETGFYENIENMEYWPMPNVIGINLKRE